ncbi:MAG: hypothetical protein ACHRXM_32910 [Isosphaerales bacterium]
MTRPGQLRTWEKRGAGECPTALAGPVVFALSPVLGAFFAIAAGANWAGWVYMTLIMLLYPPASAHRHAPRLCAADQVRYRHRKAKFGELVIGRDWLRGEP